MANVLSQDRKLAVLRLLVEGNSLRGIERATGTHRRAVTRVLTTFGSACRDFLDAEMRDLTLNHVQVDEIWTFVRKKQRRLTPEEQGDPTVGDMYLWVCFDEETKLIPTFAVGKRSADMARRLMVDLAGRLVLPKPHESDDHAWQKGAFQYVTKISTDGFAGYPEAVDLGFGPYAKYGQCIKDFRNADRKPGNYSPAEIVSMDRRPIFGHLDPWEICTSHVERNNLTIRLFVKRFARLTVAFSKKLENLADACALHFAYFNYCWRPRKPGKSGQFRVTPAMAAGLTDRPWRVEQLYAEVASRYL